MHFNTSHVTVYPGFFATNPWFTTNFNTSHVTVYPRETGLRGKSTRFQYISCYCLSIPANTPSSYLSSFQYISCYCLSIGSLSFTIYPDQFQYISCYCLSKSHQCKYPVMRYFNTSHVTVYHDWDKRMWR